MTTEDEATEMTTHQAKEFYERNTLSIAPAWSDLDILDRIRWHRLWLNYKMHPAPGPEFAAQLDAQVRAGFQADIDAEEAALLVTGSLPVGLIPTVEEMQRPADETLRESMLADSGEREVKASGFMREPRGDKANYVPLLTARGLDIVPAELIIRIAEHYYQGGQKYSPDNWRKGTDPESLERNRISAAGHFVKWLNGETDEDHVAAATWNMITYEINQQAGQAGDPA